MMRRLLHAGADHSGRVQERSYEAGGAGRERVALFLNRRLRFELA
jgi:hypothetical protein